jgi:hypothetical protein
MNQEAIDTPVKKFEVKPMIDPATGLPSLNFEGDVQAPMQVDDFRRLAWRMLDMTQGQSDPVSVLNTRTRSAMTALERLSWSLDAAGRPHLAELVMGYRSSIRGAEIIASHGKKVKALGR